MKQEKLIKNALPHFIAVLVMLLILVVYFKEVVIGNKVIQQGDVKNFLGMSKEAVDYRNSTGQEAYWIGNMFSGMPAYQVSLKMYGNWARYIDEFLWRIIQRHVAMLFITMLGFYVLLNVMKINPYLSLAGALGYGFSSYFFIIIEAGHNSKLWAISYIAWVVAGLMLIFYRNKRVLGTTLLAFGLGMEIYANHLQITYYLLLTILIFAINELIFAIKHKQIKPFVIGSTYALIGALIGILMNTTLILTTSEYAKYSTRGKSELIQINSQKKSSGLDPDYAFSWSYGVSETFTLMIPRFMGGSSNETKVTTKDLKEIAENQEGISFPTYWGDKPFTSGPVYVGAIICFLFVWAMFILPHRYKWWLFTSTLLSIFLAWGRNFEAFNMLFFNYFPGYNKFRTVEMILVIAEFTMPFLAFMGLAHYVQHQESLDKNKVIKQFYYALGITAGLCLVIGLLGPSIMSFTAEVDKRIQQKEFVELLRAERANMLRIDALRSFLFIVLSAGLLWAYMTKKIQLNLLAIGLCALITIDMLPVNRRYLGSEAFVEPVSMEIQPYASDDFLKKNDNSYYRVYAFARGGLTQDAHTPYFHKSIGGYHGAKLKRYQELIENQLEKMNPNVLNMLNTKYIILNQQVIIPTNVDSSMQKINPGTEIIHKAADGEFVLRNNQAYGHAWITPKIEVVNTPDEALKKIGTVDSRKVAIVEKKMQPLLKPVATDSIRSTEYVKLQSSYSPNKLVYEANLEKDRFITFSEIYYPKGWVAKIDGNPVPIIQTNYVLRGLIVPAGKHTIEFTFEPKVYFIGENVSKIASLIWIGLVAATIYLSTKKRKPLI
ncbi:MAG: YfhO family protein [Bacteroidia bacterium]|nr:YfhO family protein [Bacteroidia bacterium]